MIVNARRVFNLRPPTLRLGEDLAEGAPSRATCTRCPACEGREGQGCFRDLDEFSRSGLPYLRGLTRSRRIPKRNPAAIYIAVAFTRRFSRGGRSFRGLSPKGGYYAIYGLSGRATLRHPLSCFTVSTVRVIQRLLHRSVAYCNPPRLRADRGLSIVLTISSARCALLQSSFPFICPK
jgi:hypothetical protein